jgi:hypothetical protein
MKVSKASELRDNDLMFHFVPEIEENTIDINEDVKQYVNHFFNKLCNDYDTKPNSIGLGGEVSTLVKVIGRLVQDYEKYKGLNEEFTLI